MQREHLGHSIGRPGRMVDHFHRLGVGGEHGCLVARLERGPDALGVSRGGIRAHEGGGSLRHLTGDQRIEARESLGFAIGVEPLRAREPPLDVGGEEHEKGPLVGATAEALVARVHLLDEHRVRLQREDRVVPEHDIAGDLAQGAEVVEERGGATDGPGSEPPVIDRLEVGGEHGRPAIEIALRPHLRSHRACRRRRALTLRALGQQLGVALVEAGNRIAEAVGREHLCVPAETALVDLEELDPLVLVGADVVATAGGPGRAVAAPYQKKGLAERCERLDLVVRITRLQQALDGGRARVAPVRRSRRVIDLLMALIEDGRYRIEVARGESGVEAGLHRGRRVRTHAPPPRRRCGDGLLGGDVDRRDATAIASRALQEQRRSLRLPELDRATLLGVGLGATSGRPQGGRQRHARVGVVEERVGGGGDPDGGLRQRDGGGVLAALRQGFGASPAPGDRRLEIVAGERLALARAPLRFGDPLLREQGAGEQRRRAGRVDPEPQIAQPLVRAAERALGRRRVALEEIDATGERVGLEEPVRDAKLFHHRARRPDHAPGRVGAPAERFEHPLAAERHRLDRERPLRDPQHAHHVEAAAARARHRARSPERRERCARQDRIRAAPITGTTSGGERQIERRLAGADLPEARERLRMDEESLRLAGGITERGQIPCRGADAVGGRLQRLRRGEHGELAREARVPGAQPGGVGGDATELVDGGAGQSHVARGQQRLAPVERQIGSLGSVRREPIDGAPEETRRQGHVVACERPTPGGSQALRRTLPEAAPALVERAQLTQMLVCLLQVPSDRFVVLGRVADPRLDPVGEPLVQLGARPLEEPPVRRVADQQVVKAEGRLAEEPTRVALDELAPAKRFEACVEIAAVAPQKRSDRAPREMTTHDRGALEHGPVFGPQALDARGEQRVDGGGHLQCGQPGADRPAVTLLGERAFLHQHAHQLAHEERVALARGEHLDRDRGGQIGRTDHVRRQPHRRAGVETAEHDHVGDEPAGRRERRAEIAQLRARADQHAERHAAAPLHQVLHQVEEERLRPLQVVDHQDHGARGGETGEEPPDDEERFLGRRGRAAEQRRHAAGDACPLGVVDGGREGGGDRGAGRLAGGAVVETEDRSNGLGERRERGAPGGIAVRREDRRRLRVAARELVDQARLAQPGRAQQHGEPRGRGRDRGVVHGAQPPDLVVAADEGRGRRARRFLQRHDTIRADGFVSALEDQAAERLQGHEGGDEAPGGFADHDVAVARLVLEARRDVDRVADQFGLVLGDDFAGVDRDAQADLADEIAVPFGELSEHALHVDGGAHGANGIVLGNQRKADYRHHAVAEQLGHPAAVLLHGAAHRAVVAFHEEAGRLGVQPFVQGGRAGQVGEDDGDHLAPPGGIRGGRGHRRRAGPGAALATELRGGA